MKKLVICLLAVIVLVGVVGCASKETMAYPATTTTMAFPAVQESSGIFHGTGKTSFDTAMGPSVTAVPAPTTITVPMSAPYEDISSSSDSYIPAERMVIKTANVVLVVQDVTISLQQINDLAKNNGGFVINSNIREDQSRLYADISFRVQAAKFDSTLQSLRNLAVNVRSESTSGQDVTEEYIDLDAKLRNLEASESQLLVLMNKAGTVEEILKVQQQLTSTRSEINQLKGRMQYLEQSSSLSSIYVSLEQSKLTVEFVANTSTTKEGKKIQFYPNISGGFEPYSYEWSFGDGQTSTESVPVHAYKKDGMYTVKLTIKDDKGSTAFAERKDYINVLTGWDAGNVVSGAWNGLVAFGRFLLTVIIGIGIFSPVESCQIILGNVECGMRNGFTIKIDQL